MNVSPLKLSLGVSLLIHGAVIGGVSWLGYHHQTTPTLPDPKTTTLELIAAPASAPKPSVAPPVATGQPALPPEEIIPEKLPEPTPVEAAIIPLPAPPLQPVSQPQLIAKAVIPMTETVTAPATVPGDNSSPIPGQDFTTVPGSPAAQAKPDYLKNPEPEYPIQARRRGQEGLVLLNVTVSGSGRATEVSVKQSSGYDLLDQAALKAVRTWQFEPARIGVVGVESKIEVPVRFKLTR